MRSEKKLKYKGKEVSYLLRHKKDYVDKNGYAPISDVLERTFLTAEELDWIVDNNNKKRFAYSEDKTLIRANQGHNKDNEVDLGLKAIPAERVPFSLYHGTSPDNLDIIRKKGLLPMSRHHVHLSTDEKTALNVGGRHSKKPVILEIHAKLMSFEGYPIFRSKNGVYLTDHVPSIYINFPE